MGEQEAARIERMVREGLDAFGVGDVDRAVECWQGVLRLAPDHAEAREFLETALSSSRDGRLGEAEERGEDPLSSESLLREARELLRQDELESALDHLSLVAQLDPGRTEVQGYIDMVRSRLLRRYRTKVGELGSVLRVVAKAEAIKRYNLGPDAGFLLSLLDGATSVEQLLSLSGMDAFQVLRILCRLLDAGIAVVEP
jgi:tetratricopeptide (TPR) repeat protein